MAHSTPQKDPLEKEIRIVLIGKPGDGKTETRNTILGEKKYVSLPSSKSVGRHCKHSSTRRFGKYLHIVDPPAFQYRQSLTNMNMKKQIAECVTLLSPGIHAILFVIRIGHYVKEDAKILEEFINTFGYSSRRYVIAVFTDAGGLTGTSCLETYIQDADKSLIILLEGINNRYIAVNNDASSEVKKLFVRQLLNKIEQVQKDNGGFFTCLMFKYAEEEIKRVEAEKLKEIVSRNKDRDARIFADTLAEYQVQIKKEHGEENDNLIAKRKAALTQLFSERSQYEARRETRQTLSSAIISGTFDDTTIWDNVLGDDIGAEIGDTNEDGRIGTDFETGIGDAIEGRRVGADSGTEVDGTNDYRRVEPEVGSTNAERTVGADIKTQYGDTSRDRGVDIEFGAGIADTIENRGVDIEFGVGIADTIENRGVGIEFGVGIADTIENRGVDIDIGAGIADTIENRGVDIDIGAGIADTIENRGVDIDIGAGIADTNKDIKVGTDVGAEMSVLEGPTDAQIRAAIYAVMEGITIFIAGLYD